MAGKNIKKLDGKPLIQYTIEEALKILRSQNRTFRTRFFYSTKWQFAIAGGDCTPIVSF